MLKSLVSGIKLYLDKRLKEQRDETDERIADAKWHETTTTQLFSETVTTADDGYGIVSGTLAYTGDITSDTITVTFNGEEYVCNRIDGPAVSHIYGGWDVETNSPKFDEIPFAITTGTPFGNLIYTQTAGTYTISVSTKTVTTTDTFKQAVNDIAGWKTESEAVLFDENVTTAAWSGGNIATLSYAEPITADTLKVTFDGVEYICPKISGSGFVAYGGVGETEPDYTEFPFVIMSDGRGNSLYTEVAGAHTISVVTDTISYTDAFKEGVHKLSNVVKLVDGVTTGAELTNALQDGKLLYFYYGEDSSVSRTLHIITGPSTLPDTYKFIPEDNTVRAVIANDVFRVLPNLS